MNRSKSKDLQSSSRSQLISRRKLLKVGACTAIGLASSSLVRREREAEAAAPILIYAGLAALAVAPILVDRAKHILNGSVQADNSTQNPVQGHIRVVVLDADRRFDVQDYYGTFNLPPYGSSNLQFQGLVPNGSGQKYAYAEARINRTDPHSFYWDY